MKYKIMEYDDVLKLYEADLDLRVNSYHKKREEYRKSEQLRLTKEKRKDLLS